MTDWTWVTPFLRSAPAGQLNGYYNHNYVAEHAGQQYLVRVPIPDADVMDLRAIPENVVLRYLETHAPDFPAPRVLYESPQFSVHTFLPGQQFHSLYPRSDPFPDWVPVTIARQMRTLHQLDPSPFAPYCREFAQSPHSTKVYQKMLALVEDRYTNDLLVSFPNEYAALGIPEEPFAEVQILGSHLHERNFTVCHCDVHRKNLLLGEQQTLAWLDWELSLVADPVYDIAVHFHKMRYGPGQEDLFLAEYGQGSNLLEMRKQVNLYLQLERVKSALIDFGRLLRDVRQGLVSKEDLVFRISHYHQKLVKASHIWRLKPIGEHNLLQSLKT